MSQSDLLSSSNTTACSNTETDEFLLNTYSWITKEYFEKIIKQQELNYKTLTVTDVNLKSALGKGENYSSHIIKANVQYEVIYETEIQINKSFSFIIKAELQINGATASLNNELNMVNKEIDCYEKLLPRVYQLLEAINDNTKMSAKCYSTGRKPFHILFEDLTEKGYVNADKNLGFSMDYFKLVLIKLAKWHASTAVIMQQDKSLLIDYMLPAIHKHSDVFLNLYSNTLLACYEVIKTWTDYDEIAEKLRNLSATNRLSEKLIETFSRDPQEFNVLNHGDLWSNNIMFLNKGKNKNIAQMEDAILVDFSIGYWGSPGLDLTNLLYTSSHIDVQEKEWDLLIMYYYNELMLTLNALKYTGVKPTLKELQCSVIKHGMSAVILSIIVIGIRKSEPTENIVYSTLIDTSIEYHQIRVKMLSKPECKPQLKYLIDFYNRKGYLD